MSEIVEHLYKYLPASGAPTTFGTVAMQVGVDAFWPQLKLSKTQMLQALLTGVLESRRDRFCPLIVAIVRSALQYRRIKKDPLTHAEISTLNGLIKRIGFKIPELHDPAFLASLAGAPPLQSNAPPAAANAPPQSTNAPSAAPARRSIDADLTRLQQLFLTLHTASDRQQAGRDLEQLLNALFSLFEMAPRAPFRVVGEQIDGSFYFEKEFYLLEAKWTSQGIAADELYVFDRKIAGKAQFTRGLFLSINGFTSEAIPAITKNKCPNFIMLDGSHLYRVLAGHISLPDLMMSALRRLAETGEPFVPISTLLD